MSDNGDLLFVDLKGICTRSQVKHWQRIGLLPDEREQHGQRSYRTFDPATVERIREIVRLRGFGLSCAGVKRYFEKKASQKAEAEPGASQAGTPPGRDAAAIPPTE